ncbi:FAD-dependent monooxygenase [Kibdelosporangium persicum]|uniref:Pentachlorophenol monooxygenase n=1 Tax=Kibdelosporangium persicum TaxID=2698649 RepID=A0ABX2F795_9PSEU|nr:FAD-dependent monooxygenase [Kibdelosporangium persicum]NRN67221.1 Pentachlorophenol monooxygenase [Kibdelosporangium persicum]
MRDTSVIVAGAGPVGLLLAGELRLGGADVIVLERLTEPVTESRASALHARTMELFDQRGLLDELGTLPCLPMGHFGGIPLDLTAGTRYPGQWKLPQTRTEALLERWATRLGARVRRGREVTGLTETADCVEVEVSDVETSGVDVLRADYVVGCDGEQSTVRRLAGFDFPGQDAGRELIRADIVGIEIPNRRFERHSRGVATAYRYPDGLTRVMVHEFGARPRTTEPAFGDLVGAWSRVTGEDISGAKLVWLNAFGDARRQAARYRKGRVMLAGDAAHQQLPTGGQALNLGLQDAMNLGWKLAAKVRGDVDLLDTYHEERHPVGEHVLTNIAAQTQLLFGDRDVEPVRTVLAELMAMEPVRAHLAEMISGLGIRYDMGPGGHPLLGTRTPPIDALRTGKGVLLNTSGAERWAGRVLTLTGVDGLPFDRALIRPDGHIAWVDGTRQELAAALHRWFGQPN